MQTSGDPAPTVPTVSASEISRLAGVTRATVSNWRRRHDDFPAAVGGSENRPVFDLNEVREWLIGHGLDPARSPAAELRAVLRSRLTPADVARLLDELERADGRWTIGDHRDSDEPVDEVLRALDRCTAAEGMRVAIDILAERGLEEIAATGVYPTPEPVATLMAAVVAAAAPPIDVLDPACGGGSLLCAARAAGARELYGQDVLAVQVARARLVVTAETGVTPHLGVGDSLSADAFAGLEAAAVLCNPPYGQRDWGSAELAFDPRWEYGLPPRGESELAWVQHALAHLRPGGTAAVLLPPAVAARNAGRKIRANLVRAGTLRAVIGLPPGVAQPWHIGLHIWVLRKSDSGPVGDHLLFVDTDTEQPDTDWAALSDRVAEAWRTFLGATPRRAADAGLAAVARLIDVLDDTVDLTPARYVRTDLEPRAVSDRTAAAVTTLGESTTRLAAQVAALTGWRESPERSWRSVTVAELADRGRLDWIRAVHGGPVDAESAARPVLTAPDVASGAPPSATTATVAPAEATVLAAGDILVPAVRSDRGGGRAARVAGPQDAGAVRGPHIHLLRADPASLDPWFVAGFLGGGENQPMTRTATIRFDPSRLRIPILPLAEQHRYGALFRELFLTRVAAREAADAAERAAEQLTAGLTAGALEPDDTGDRR
ncbi:N-6 DNA methylase [Nocardia bovistercoris]|uniref:N-6 DNA methylase n=1 Tax=Nocardia bovistercoris TaxID=2785916 RepID=A0A931IGP5_9NOCA|nr:N-6 DNA methylase [Nocardia bovistercoris]MBH0779343.1 N-6 DNA methylase [Nocardia bovistercoris]